MNILAIDTSTKYLSIGIISSDKIISAVDIYAQLKTSGIIVPQINKLLKKYKLELNDFDAFCIGLGPGSFTGLRIGLSTIKAFGFCVDKKMIGVPSLDLIALNVKDDGNICVISDARRNLLYVSFYRRKNGKICRQGKISLLTIDKVLAKIKDNTYILGDGISIVREIMEKSSKEINILEEGLWYPKARNLCVLAKEMFKKNKFIDIEKLKPLYLYPKDCQIRR